MISPLLLAAALAVAAPADAAPADAAPADSAPPAPRGSPTATSPAGEPEIEISQPAFDRHGWRHAIGLGAHSTTFFSKEGSQYTFHSGSLGYLASIGARGAFLHAFLLMPLQARQDGHVYATGNYYSTRSGGDLLTGPQWRWIWRGHIEAEAGPGLHATFIYLPGKPGYRDFSALPLGLGAGAALRWETRKERFSRVVTVGTYASIAYDFYDPMHAEDLAHGFTLHAGVIVGLGGRR